VGVGGAEALEDDRADVGLVVAVGVFEIPEIRPGGDDHAVAPELETERVVDVREDLPRVGDAVAVGIFENHQAVVHLLERFPLGIGVPAGHPEPPLRIDLHLDRVDQVGELLFRGKHVQFEAFRHADLGPAFLG